MLSAQLNSYTLRHWKGIALIFPFKPKYCGMVCTSFYILYRTYKQGGLARLFSRVFFPFVYVPDTLQYYISILMDYFFWGVWLYVVWGPDLSFLYVSYPWSVWNQFYFYIQSSATGKDRIYGLFSFIFNKITEKKRFSLLEWKCLKEFN